MSDTETPETFKPNPDEPRRLTPVAAAALLGGTMAAAAGAYFGTRAIARRNREKDGRPLNSVMATAITASELAHRQQKSEPSIPAEPKVPTEPDA